MNSTDDLWYTGQIEQHRLQTSRGIVEYADVGQGLPILYFHGNDVGNDSAVIMDKSLLDDGFRLIAPNRPGYYGTPITSGRTPSDCADLAAELLAQLQVERAVIIGTSAGGAAACRFAARHPQKTAALVLQCALSHRIDSGRWMLLGLGWLLPLFRHLSIFRPVLRFGHRQLVRKLAGGQIASQFMTKERFAELRDSPALKSLESLLCASLLRCSEYPDGYENDWATWTGDPWLTPGSVSCPTLILHDRADTVVPFAHAEWSQHCIPTAELCALHTAGHLIWIGQDQEKMRTRR